MQDINSFRNRIICGHVLDALKEIPDSSVDIAITSPPYWGLRDYETNPIIWGGNPYCQHEWCTTNGTHRIGRDDQYYGSDVGSTEWKDAPRKIIDSNFCSKCGAWRGQLGLEPSFELYIKHLCDIFDEVKRVLSNTGTCFVNIGDTYSGSWGDTGHISERDGAVCHQREKNTTWLKKEDQPQNMTVQRKTSVPNKSLCLVPFRFGVEMVNRGWIMRNVIIWHKPNCLPASVKDRFTVDFEYVFFFVKSRKYYFEQQFEPHQTSNLEYEMNKGSKWGNKKESTNKPNIDDYREDTHAYGIYGRNKRCVWNITTHGFPDAHFAVYPPALIEPMIKSGCPEQVCKKCGQPRVKVLKSPLDIGHTESDTKYDTKVDTAGRLAERRQAYRALGLEGPPLPKVVGYTDCGCGNGFNRGVVLDPFMGSGTTAVVAKNLNRDYIGIELNQSYVDIANKRIFENEVKHCRDSDCNKIKAITNVEDA